MTGTTSSIPDRHPGEIDFAFHPQRFDRQLKRSTGWRAGVPALDLTEKQKAGAGEIFVDSAKGSDSAAGTISAPLRTIAAAVAKAEAANGGAIRLRTGVFILSESVTITGSDISISPYTPSSSPEEVLVSGGVSIKGTWTKVPSLANTVDPAPHDTYSTPVPKGLTFLELFNSSANEFAGARLIPARNPNGNPETDENNFKFGGKATSCRWRSSEWWCRY
jgi:hypothetical protein